jgi:hypothetical protein
MEPAVQAEALVAVAKFSLTSSREDTVAGKIVESKNNTAPAVRRVYVSRDAKPDEIGHALMKVQQQSEKVFNALRQNIFGSCRLKTGIQGIANTQQTIYHGLNRVWAGCFALSNYGALIAVFATRQTPLSLDATSMLVTPNATGTFDLVVF